MRTKAEVLPELEAKILEYMQAGTSIQSLMLDGFVLKVRAVDVEQLGNPQVMGTTIWLTPANQDVFKSLGLAEAMVQDVRKYYADLFDNAYNEDEDD